MINQPIPKATRGDVERVIRRDFLADQFAKVMSILDESTESIGNDDAGRARIQLSILKLAQGKMDSFASIVEIAKCDYRDVLMSAEYPECVKIVFMDELTVEEQGRIVAQDWKQYETWLNAK